MNGSSTLNRRPSQSKIERYLSLAGHLFRDGKTEEARGYLDQVLQWRPENDEALALRQAMENRVRPTSS